MSLTSAVQMRLAMRMRDEFFLYRTHKGFQTSEPAEYKISVTVALEIVKWLEQQPEAQNVEARKSSQGNGRVQEGNAEEQQRSQGHEQEASNRDRQE